MKTESIHFEVKRSKHRAQFLFNDGEFRPRSEKKRNQYQRRDKHQKQFYQHSEWFNR